MNSDSEVIQLSGYRVRLKNRRVYASEKDGEIWLKWVRLVDGKRHEKCLRLSAEAAGATATLILGLLGAKIDKDENFGA